MSDVRIEIEPNRDTLFAHRIESDLVPSIAALGLSVDPLEPPLEERSADPNWPIVILLTLNLAATALRDADDIIDIVRKWLRRPRRESAPKQIVKLYGPDGEVLAEIEQHDD